LLLNTWWPYILDHPSFASTVPFADLVFPPEDVTPPSAPAGLEGIPLGASQIALAWDEAADNIGVTRYAVYRNGELLRKTPSPFFTDTRLRPGTDYAYAVKACDGSGNTSPTAATVNVRTLAAEPQGALVNGRFEVNPQASAWITDAYRPSAVTYTWEGRGEGRRGTRCVALNASELNDARWARTVTGLVPGAT
jgi:hypothetical protein